MKKSSFIIFFVFAIFAALMPCDACGPWFPPTFIDGDERTSRASSEFGSLLLIVAKQYMPETDKIPEYKPSSMNSSDADISDFTEMMNSDEAKKIIPSGQERNKIIFQFTKFADAVRAGEKSPVKPEFPDALKPLVEEFVLYLDGVKTMNENPFSNKIPDEWKKLLNLPEKSRKYRTVHALYMIGNLHSKESRIENAHKSYEAVRKAVDYGFKDSCGLAFASFKRDFICETDKAEKLKYGLKAFAYYCRATVPIEGEHASLISIAVQLLAETAMEGDSELEKLADDDVCAEMILARYLSRMRGYEKIAKPGIILAKRTKLMSERMAFIAYESGMNFEAERWLQSSGQDSLLATWLRAEIARNHGRHDEAAEHYKKWLAIFKDAKDKNEMKIVGTIRFISEGFSHAFHEEVYGQLGVTSIHRRDFMEALHCFMKAGSWADAAYIAESILEIKELKAYVDAYEGRRKTFFKSDDEYEEYLRLRDETGNDTFDRDEISDRLEYKDGDHYLGKVRYNYDYCHLNFYNFDIYGQLRWLLARRMMREKDYDNAIKYMPSKLVERAKTLFAFLKKAEDKKLGADERALAKYNAAKIIRQYGLSMMGTELAPDSNYTRGNDEYGPRSSETIPAELRAMEEANLPDIPFRFHYRHLAAAAMLEAAELAKDINIKALAYYVGGRFIADRHPILADPFYKKLVLLRNRYISAEADKKRWFPKNFSDALENEVKNSEPVTDIEHARRILSREAATHERE